MDLRETGRKTVRRWTAALVLLGFGVTGIGSVGTWVAIEQASTTAASTTSGSTSTSSSSSSSGSAASSGSSSSSGVSSGSGTSQTSSGGS